MKYYTTAQVIEKTTLSRSTLWRLEKDDKFPKPRRILNGYRKVYVAEEIDRWMEDAGKAVA